MQRSQREIAKVTQQYFVVRAPVAGQISGNAGRPFSSSAIAGEGGGGVGGGGRNAQTDR